MGTIVLILGWCAALLLAAALLSSARRLVRHLRDKGRSRQRDAAHLLTPLLCACGTLSAAAGLGVLPLVPGMTFAVTIAVVCGWLLMHDTGYRPAAWWPAARVLFSHARGAARYLREDARALRDRRGGDDGEPERVPVIPVPAPAPAAGGGRAAPPPPRPGPAREVPSLRNDPVLGEAPAPQEVAENLTLAAVPVPAPWAALCEHVASFEADTDEDLIAHVAGEAAGVLAYAEAVRARADTLLHGTGLDPAYVAGHHEFADEFADLASAVALLDARFHAIYEALRQWVAEHPEGMPHKAREWLQAGASPAEDAGPGDQAAA